MSAAPSAPSPSSPSPSSHSAAPRTPGQARWSRSGVLSLFAVVAVLVVVSLPRLSDLAQQENEADARETARLLARELGSGTNPAPSLPELLRRPALRGLCDAELLAGELLRRHGYLFEVTALPHGLSLADLPAALLWGRSGSLRPIPAIRAWPWTPGRSGRVSFLVSAGGGMLVREAAGSDGAIQAAQAREKSLGNLSGWRPIH